MKRTFTLLLAIWALTANAQNFEWSPQTSGVTDKLNDVFFVDNQNGWVVGDNGIILNTTDGGQNWTSQTGGVSEILRAVFFINADTGWAVGGSLNKALIKTTDGGSNWQSIAPSYNGSKQMFDIAFFDANTGWLIAFDSIYRTTDGGDTWVSEGYTSNTESPNVRSIAVTSDTIAYMAGSRKKSSIARQADVFYRRPENSPFLWSFSGFGPPVSSDNFRSIEFINSDIGFAGGQRGQLYKKTDFSTGGPWELNFELLENQTIWSISFPNESHGMFLSSVEISGTTNAIIYHTSDSGETWSVAPDTIPDLLLAVLYAPDSVNAWTVGVGGKIYKGTQSVTGINQLGLNIDVSIYPNPASDFIHVELNSGSHEAISYTLTDVAGRLIKNAQWHSTSSDSHFTIDISQYRNGVYLLNLSTDEGHSTFRVLKN